MACRREGWPPRGKAAWWQRQDGRPTPSSQVLCTVADQHHPISSAHGQPVSRDTRGPRRSEPRKDVGHGVSCRHDESISVRPFDGDTMPDWKGTDLRRQGGEHPGSWLATGGLGVSCDPLVITSFAFNMQRKVADHCIPSRRSNGE